VIPVDVRIIATTNKDLGKEVREKRFRGDLFYRLNVLQFSIPPLRERGKDAYALFRHFILRLNPKCPKRHVFKKEVEGILGEHTWPGNVRELRNLVERLAHLTENFTGNLGEVPKWIHEELQKPEGTKEIGIEMETKNLNLKELEQWWIKKISESSPLKKTDLAKLLGISRTTLWKKIKVS
jgi:transcriptional regulator with PAS, ATPase and Fis domain